MHEFYTKYTDHWWSGFIGSHVVRLFVNKYPDVRAFHDTYGMPTIVTNCSNNYGPYQFPEKLIPLFINNIRHSKPLPVYGKGENVRDWLYVVDHARAIDLFSITKNG